MTRLQVKNKHEYNMLKNKTTPNSLQEQDYEKTGNSINERNKAANKEMLKTCC